LHLPDIGTGIGPFETKAERPAPERGFWNRFDATARCRAVEERDEVSDRIRPAAIRIPNR
jgi:hypothetical protein